MTTTHLFVELLVIGFGALAWIFLIVAMLFGYEVTAIQGEILSLGTLFPVLSLAYVFGILTDRLADWLFDKIWGKAQFESIYGEGQENRDKYFTDRRTLIVEGPDLWHFREYGRSRLRICRGWTLNSILLLVSSDLYLLLGSSTPAVTGWRFGTLNIAIGLLAFLCWISWKKLNKKEYEKIYRQAEWIRGQNKQNKT